MVTILWWGAALLLT